MAEGGRGGEDGHFCVFDFDDDFFKESFWGFLENWKLASECEVGELRRGLKRSWEFERWDVEGESAVGKVIGCQCNGYFPCRFLET